MVAVGKVVVMVEEAKAEGMAGAVRAVATVAAATAGAKGAALMEAEI